MGKLTGTLSKRNLSHPSHCTLLQQYMEPQIRDLLVLTCTTNIIHPLLYPSLLFVDVYRKDGAGAATILKPGELAIESMKLNRYRRNWPSREA